MRTSYLALGFLVTASVASAVACNHQVRATAPTEDPNGATNLQPNDVDAVVERLALARCERENTCNRVGNGRAYGTKNACMTVMRVATRRELAAAADCRDKFDGVALDQCDYDVRALRCADSLDTVTSLDTCRTDRLCK